ncbi:TPA: YshB family small membrane protein, partial [Escherichia coli]|nr:YshB family small membrane protein [Escherichia coli]
QTAVAAVLCAAMIGLFS